MKPRPKLNEISWDRVRSIFDYPSPPKVIWERHFDYDQEGFEEFVRTPYEEIDFRELHFYHYNLTHQELQPEVFAYLFPVCLMDWHESLMNDQPCYLHEAVVWGRVLERMLSDQQRKQVFEFFRDSFSARLEAQRGLPSWDQIQAITREDLSGLLKSYAVIRRFNSLGKTIPDIQPLWEDLWGMRSAGSAVVTARYCFDLVYEVWRPIHQNLCPHLPMEAGLAFIAENDSQIYGQGWLPGNLQFVSGQLTVEFVRTKLERAGEVLRGEPEEGPVLEMLKEVCRNPEVAAINLEALLKRLQAIQ